MTGSDTVMIVLTAVLAAATVALVWATLKYVRAMHIPVVSAFFETDGTWIYLVVQNTGTETAWNTVFSIDLSSAELQEIFGPNLHGERYIVHEDLEFLKSVRHLAPQHRVRHRWLFLNFALRDKKPRPCTLTIDYETPWKSRGTVNVHFDVHMFGTYDMAHLPDKTPEEQIAETLKSIAQTASAALRRMPSESA